MSDLPECSHDPTGIHPFEAREHMNDQWSSHFETLSLTEIIRLQNQLSATLTRRFERPYALIFSDIVGSTAYFSRYGDEAGRRLQQQHFDLLSNAMIGTQGQFFHTAGDGALLGLPAVETAADTMVRFHQSLRQLTYRLPSEQQWTTRTAIHWGQILIDGKTVAGDTVNLCAKVAATAQPGEIRVTKAAFAEFPNRYRFLCEPLGLIPISSINQPIELMRLSWYDAVRLPTLVLIEETGQRITLPDQPVISLGRSREVHGVRVNDIALQLTDPDLTQKISRYHLEVRTQPDGLVIRSLSENVTEVDGKQLAKGQESPLHVGSVVRLSNVMTLQFLSALSPQSPAEITTVSNTRIHPG